MTATIVTEGPPGVAVVDLPPTSPLEKKISEKCENAAAAEAGDTSSDGATPPPEAVETISRWNSPPINKYRTLATFWSFLVVGMNDGSYGALLPHLELHYGLNYTVVSLVFLSPFVGYAIASAVNNLVHVHFGQRGVAFMAPLCHFVPYLIFSFHPPYPVMVVMYIFVGMGNGLADAAWCAFIGQMANAHEMSGILQACYALGATIAPLIATALASHDGPGWWAFYWVITSASAVEFFVATSTFWSQTGDVYLAENPMESGGKSGRTRAAMKNKLTWLFAFFVFGYCGAEVALGGWIVVFMTRIRGATSIAGGAAATGFWGGMTAGRLFLSFLTARLGEFWSMILYLGLTIVFELVFWLVPNMIASAVAAAMLGVVMGPMFPTAVVLITKVLPRSLHVGTIGFATAFGGSGGAILPFLVGAIANNRGVQALQPFILAVCVALAILWSFVPHSPPKKAADSDEEAAGTPVTP